MNPREFKILAAVTGAMLVLTVVAYAVFHRTAGHEYAGKLWLEALDVNAVTRIDVRGPEPAEQVTLDRRPEGWGVAQRRHYPAQVGMIRRLLLDLSEAKLFERKTDDPEQHAQLGLGRIDESGAVGQRVVLHFGDDRLVVRIGAKPSGRNATYVRVADDDQAWLVDRTFAIPAEPRRWLEPTLMDIGMEGIERIRIEHPDGEVVEGRRTADDGEVRFEMLRMPAGRSLKNAFILNRAAGSIASLSLEDVMPAEQARKHLLKAPRITYTMRSGYVLEAQLFAVDIARYARFAVRVQEEAGDEVRAEAERLAAHVRDWAFRIPSFAYDSMALRWSDILEEE